MLVCPGSRSFVAFLQTGHPFKARRHLREALRIDPDAETEEAFQSADKACRWLYLPMYFFGYLTHRFPGKNIGMWLAVLGSYFFAKQFDAIRGPAEVMLWCYIGLAIYTWFADPLVSAWIRFRPAR